MKSWLKRIAIAFGTLLLVMAATLWWLLDSASGMRFALARIQGATHGALHVQLAQGRLLGPLDLAGVRYDDGHGTVAKLAKVHLDLRFWPLLERCVHVLALDVGDVDMTLPTISPAEESNGKFSLKPPLDLLLDRVHVGSVKVTQGGRLLFASDHLDLAGSWTSRGIALGQLALKAPDGHVDLIGKLAIGEGQQADGNASFAWRVGEIAYAGSLAAHSDGKLAHIDLKLTQPAAARLQLDLAQRGDYAWTARLDAPRFDAAPLLGDSSLKTLAIAVQGHGDRYSGTLDGRLDLNSYPLLLQPLRAQLSDDFKTLTLQQLSLGSPQIKGSIIATGVVQLDASPFSAALDIHWDDLQLPAQLVGQALASHGNLKAKGSVEAYHAEGDIAIGPPGKLAGLALNLDGSPRQITLHTLQLKQPQGGLQANGTLVLQPAPAWQIEASADRFDPGQLFAGWNGALDFDLVSNGTLPQAGPDVTLEIRKLAGKLREHTISGHGKLHLAPDEVIEGRLDLASDGSSVRVDAKGTGNGSGAGNDIDLKLAIASLGDWWPDAGGRLNGEFRVRGRQPKLGINGQLRGSALAYRQQRIDGLQLNADVPDISRPGGQLDLQLHGVEASGLLFQQVSLRAAGTPARHSLNLDARGTQLSGELALDGVQKGSTWHGVLSTLKLEPEGLPGWRLQQPAQLGYNDGTMSLSGLCLSAGDPRLCVTAKQDKAGNLDATYQLHALPLALLMNAAGEAGLPVRTDGTLEGDGKLHRNAVGALSGNAAITSAHGSITYTDHADAPLLNYEQLSLTAELNPSSQRIDVHSKLDQDGRLDGQITVSGAQRVLGGQLAMHLGNLAFIELFSNDVANVKGALDADFRFAGTLQQPAISGQARITDFAAEVPAAGLKLNQGRLVASTIDARQFHVDGSVRSGNGTLAISGNVAPGGSAQATIALKGSQFTAAEIPAAKVLVSPDLTVQQDANGIGIGGTLMLDSADVNLEKLPGAGATRASPDVVVIDQKQQEPASSQLPVGALVRVDLGRKTHVVGMGLDGHLSGVLTVSERPGRATTGQGQIAVDGTYRAYGQNLHIERGQLLFASTPIDNPGLSIRAVRKLNPNSIINEGQEVGLLVSGTAQRPILNVFSNPVMEQSDALSYLVTGKPLSQVKGGEGDMVGAAAQALGSAAGDLLAKSIGTKIGVDDIGVSSNVALGGNSAFTVGKYLSPRLYLSYGVGLFASGQVVTLRYRLSQRWNFEAQNATDFSRASLNYRYER